MKKFYTTLFFCFLAWQGWSVTCTVDAGAGVVAATADFIACANNPTTTRIEFVNVPNPRLGTLTISNVDLSGITIAVPKGRLVFSENVIFDSGTIFEGSNANAEVQIGIGGTLYQGASSPTLATLNFYIGECPTNPSVNPAACSELNTFLPVELTHFEAKSKENMVELAWTTASELNNEFFQVEHSRDGINFNPIGKVKGKGTTSETIEYDFMHRQPIAGTNYYRLKQVDFDGAFEYSNVVVAVLANRSGGVQVYPNPTINKATISMNERPENIKFRLSNLLGQGINLQPNQVDAGWELDLSSLSTGIYVLRMDYNGQVITKRIVKE